MMRMVWIRKEYRFGFLKLITSFRLSFGIVSILPLKLPGIQEDRLGRIKFIIQQPPSPPVRILSTSRRQRLSPAPVFAPDQALFLWRMDLLSWDLLFLIFALQTLRKVMA